MKRRSFLGGLMALPVFGLFKKAPARDFIRFTNYPVKLTEPVNVLDPFIPVPLDYGPLNVEGIIFEPQCRWEAVCPTSEHMIGLAELKSKGIKEYPVTVAWTCVSVKITYDRDVYGDRPYMATFVPMTKTEHDQEYFRKIVNRGYRGMKTDFYHLKYGDYNNLWARTRLDS